MPQERNLQTSVMRWLNAQSYTLARKLHGTGYGVVGDPDLYGCCRGRMFLIELKQPGKEPTAIQRVRLNEWKKVGAIAFVAHSLEEVKEAFARITEMEYSTREEYSPVRQ